MRLFSYVVTHDTGFSPNPFWGYCTLACCKPRIRCKAKKKDWIAGLAPKSAGNRIVYLMQVDEIESFDEYWNDPRFQQKKPRRDGGVALKCGDNIYEPNSRGGYRQIPSLHSDVRCRTHEDAENKKRDLSGKNVLISENFAYFGSKAINLPSGLRPLIVTRGQRWKHSEEVLSEFRDFLQSDCVRFGVHAEPKKWEPGDDSWRDAAGSRLIAE